MRPVGLRFEPGRTGPRRSVVPKFIIVTEGDRTEQVYFGALRDARGIAGISGLIDIVLLQREPIDSGLSHPLVVLDLLDRYMDSVAAGRHSVELVLETACDAVSSLGVTRCDARMSEFREKVLGRCADLRGRENVDEIVRVCIDASRDVFGFVPEIELPELVDYRPDTDRVCVLVDRDRDNRDEDVMDRFVTRCARSGYKPFVSNPCFEIWLMMHFDAFDSMDRRMLSENAMVDGRRFTERELDRIVREVNPENSYDKRGYDPGMFLHRTGEAVTRSMGLCHDTRCLKREPGTNIGALILEMRGPETGTGTVRSWKRCAGTRQ